MFNLDDNIEMFIIYWLTLKACGGTIGDSITCMQNIYYGGDDEE